MSNATVRRAVTIGAFLALMGTIPTFGYKMIQNTTTGTVTAGDPVFCNDPSGFAHWTNSNISWYLNTAGQGAGKATAIQNAMASWTNVANADHTLTYAGTTAAGWSTDGQNTILWASGNGCTGSCLALTALTLQSGQVIVETDITFNSAYTWQTNGSDYDTEAVAAHELGHTLGIHHTDYLDLMYGTAETMSATYVGTIGRTLESDDVSALQCAHSIYFAGNPPPSNPPAPALLDVQRELCYGHVSLSWSSSTGATYYQVEQSSNSNFAYSWLIYVGPWTAMFYDGGPYPYTTYYRVRACKDGCGSYTNGNRSGKYYSPCL